MVDKMLIQLRWIILPLVLLGGLELRNHLLAGSWARPWVVYYADGAIDGPIDWLPPVATPTKKGGK